LCYKEISKILNSDIIEPSLSYKDLVDLEIGPATISNKIKKIVIYLVIIGFLIIIPFLVIFILNKNEENIPLKSSETIPDVESDFNTSQINTEIMKGNPSQIN